MNFEFLLRLAHSRSRVDVMYWSGCSLNSRVTCSNSVMVGTTGPLGSGLPQFGLPRFFAIDPPLRYSSHNESFSVVFLFYRKLLAATLLQDGISYFFPGFDV